MSLNVDTPFVKTPVICVSGVPKPPSNNKLNQLQRSHFPAKICPCCHGQTQCFMLAQTTTANKSIKVLAGNQINTHSGRITTPHAHPKTPCCLVPNSRKLQAHNHRALALLEPRLKLRQKMHAHCCRIG
ncbi:MAG: hypothetical protein EAY75_03355 [Bacteroidetes bacterium]|nr:MAG: hypothetical protein EAY75_03355 [Bacteroidota bacterium]